MDTAGQDPKTTRLGAESGQTIVEYGMVLSIVSTALILSLILFKDALADWYDKIVAFAEGLV